MFPIPDRIIGSKQLFIPLAYIGVTVTLCYYFLIAFAQTERLNFETRSLYRRPQHHQYHSQRHRYRIVAGSSNHILQSELTSAAKFPSSVSSNDDGRNRPDRVPFHFTQVEKKFEESEDQHGPTRRSQSTQVRYSHQDSPEWINLSAPMFFPWPNDESCKNFPVRFAHNGTFKPRALVSYPGSGNSWLRYLLEGSSGIFTGSIFNDKKLIREGLLGEGREPNDGSTIVQKTHHDTVSDVPRIRQGFAKLTELMFGYRGILLIRNPYDAIRSYWNFMHTHDHKGHAGRKQFSLSKWKTFVKEGAKRWAKLIESWVENSMDYLIVTYEDLKADPKTELIRIMEYLDQPVNEDRLSCVLRHLEGPFHREDSVTKAQSAGLSFNTKDDSNLDLIVKQNIEHVNHVFALYQIPIRLHYTSDETKRNIE